MRVSHFVSVVRVILQFLKENNLSNTFNTLQVGAATLPCLSRA